MKYPEDSPLLHNIQTHHKKEEQNHTVLYTPYLRAPTYRDSSIYPQTTTQNINLPSAESHHP